MRAGLRSQNQINDTQNDKQATIILCSWLPQHRKRSTKRFYNKANVYQGETDDGKSVAIKIYKTSILVFKDRDRYVSGEFRFRHGYSKHNPRKMVKLWAEKEMRNLKRLTVAGIKCPTPIALKSHILVMSFVGNHSASNEGGLAAPRLKDADINGYEDDLYWQCVSILRKMYHECKLIHADFSEYNLLYFENQIWVIDVSQSVEHDHPHSLEFLRVDIANTNIFFRKKGVPVLSMRDFFDFVTDLNVKDEESFLQAAKQKALNNEGLSEEMLEEEVFKNSFIPRTLDDIIDVERDLDKVAKGETADLLYQKIAGLECAERDSSESDCTEDNSNASESEDSDSQMEGESDDNDSDSESKMSDNENLTEEEKKRQKKEWKKLVKEEKRERRKTKLKKHIKKRKAKLSKGNSK